MRFQDRLTALFTGVVRVRVLDGGTSNGKVSRFSSRGESSGKTLLETRDGGDIRFLQECLELGPTDGFFCMCKGWPAIELSRGMFSKTLIGLHHGQSVRVDGWESDAPLVDGRRLLEWMAARGVAEPLRELVAATAQQERATRTLERWRAAAPGCLAGKENALDGLLSPTQEQAVVTDALDRLAEAMPDPGARVRTLVTWLGHGEGPWSGYPSYEHLVMGMLESFDVGVFCAALAEAPELTPMMLAGAARSLSMRIQKQPADRERVPPGLVDALARHMAGDPVEDNRHRFARAFGART